jgi:hypothetical protein
LSEYNIHPYYSAMNVYKTWFEHHATGVYLTLVHFVPTISNTNMVVVWASEVGVTQVAT